MPRLISPVSTLRSRKQNYISISLIWNHSASFDIISGSQIPLQLPKHVQDPTDLNQHVSPPPH